MRFLNSCVFVSILALFTSAGFSLSNLNGKHTPGTKRFDSRIQHSKTDDRQDDSKKTGEKKKSPDLPLGIVKEKPDSGPFVETKYGYMVPYVQKIPGTKHSIEMIPIPGGKFKMGSPEDSEDAYADEKPSFEVTVAPFWMAKTETTWGQFNVYTDLHDLFKEFQTEGMRKVDDNNKVDAVTIASSLYDSSFTYDAGNADNTPAATMTQFTARQYSKWLSLLTEQFYRLPYEAEWEYACRAGAETLYHFGDDPDELDEYGWFEDNSDGERQPVAQKKPNSFGLYDMHGNVAEWVLDQYEEKWFSKLSKKENLTAKQTYNKPTKLFPRVIRGGSWELDADSARCAFRMTSGSEEEWKEEDPNFPKSPWWYTNEPSTGVGFRLIRPLEPPKTKKERLTFWDSAMEETGELAHTRIKLEGRGAIGLVDPKLPEAIEKLKKNKK